MAQSDNVYSILRKDYFLDAIDLCREYWQNTVVRSTILDFGKQPQLLMSGAVVLSDYGGCENWSIELIQNHTQVRSPVCLRHRLHYALTAMY